MQGEGTSHLREVPKSRVFWTDVQGMSTFCQTSGTGAVAGRLRRRGMSIVYLSVMIVVLIALGGLAVNSIQLRMTKTEMQVSADAAALYGASGIRNIGVGGSTAAFAQARASFLENFPTSIPVANRPVLLDQDIELGTWNTTTRTFANTSNPAVATALRVTVRRTSATGNPVKLMLPFLDSVSPTHFGNVTATAIALLIPGQEKLISVPATSNPWLAGMPNGTVANNRNNPHNNPDYSPQANPVRLTDVTLTPGEVLTFDGINGGANNFPTDVRFNADGNTGWIVNNKYSQNRGPEHGKSDVVSPINSLIGVFLGPDNPANTPPPTSRLDFSTSASRDFQQLEPQLKQTFFIGDGLRSDGVTQTFKIPTGTTRLFIGTMDEYEWNNNQGGFSLTAHRVGRVMLVK